MATITTTVTDKSIKGVIRKHGQTRQLTVPRDGTNVNQQAAEVGNRLAKRTGWLSTAEVMSDKASHRKEGNKVILTFPDL